MKLIDAIKAIDWKKPQSIATAIMAIGGVVVQLGWGDAEWFKSLAENAQGLWGYALAIGAAIGLVNLGTKTK